MVRQKRRTTPVAEHFIARLGAALDQTGMPQAELARRSGVSSSTITRMLQGQPPTLAQAWDLAEALDVSITDMLPLETDPRPPGLDRLIDAVRQGDAAEARAALSALVGVPTVPNPEDPHGARLLDAVARADAVDIRRALEVMLPPGTYTAVTSAPPQADLIRAVEQATTGLQALGALMKGARPPDES